jgi:hypothetical protein
MVSPRFTYTLDWGKLEIVEGASGQGDTVTRGDAKDIWFKSRGKGDMGTR